MNLDPNAYLSACPAVDFHAAEVQRKAAALRQPQELKTAQACFEFVRDSIKHSCDHQLNPVTWRASDVLLHGTGYCYAKSHLLCGLLRANGIPAGLCYQRLTVSGDRPPYCLHGLNAVYLKTLGWYRIDARGNAAGINARFTPPDEQLAFTPQLEGEYDIADIYVTPRSDVLHCLQTHSTWQAVATNLPSGDAIVQE